MIVIICEYDTVSFMKPNFMVHILLRLFRKFLKIYRFNNVGLIKNNTEKDFLMIEATHTQWDKFQTNIATELADFGVTKFGRCPTIVETMDPPIPKLFQVVKNLEKKDFIRLRKLALDHDPVGSRYRGTIISKAPDSRIQKIIYLFQIEAILDSLTQKLETRDLEIIELGAGIGELAELLITELNPKSYTIIDLPVIELISQYYLSAQDKLIDYQIKFSSAEASWQLNNSIKLFISTFALSETSLEFRKKLTNILQKSDIIFLEIQNTFDDLDNTNWVITFLDSNPGFKFYTMKSNVASFCEIYVIYKPNVRS